ncbi:MAG: cupin domain-containing protein [Veillonellales bacterium]
MEERIIEQFCTGKVACLSKTVQSEALDWNDHPSFQGVALKHLVRGEDTNGQFSAHLVRVMAGCEIGQHTHPGKWELHEVVAGNGYGELLDKKIEYNAGTVTVLPADMQHRVVAGNESLYILAKFVPALV